MNWMIIEFSLEERLAIENRARSALRHDNSEEVAELCASLIRQNAYQERLLSQATAHIAALESAQWHVATKRRPWWRIAT